MTSRTSPVSGVVLVLGSLLAVGCTTQTSALFEAALDSVGSTGSVSAMVDAAGDPTTGVGEVWWPNPDGYAMALPSGWTAVNVDGSTSATLIAIVGDELPGLGGRIDDVLATTGSSLSMVAVGTSTQADVPPCVIVLAQSTQGHRARQVKTLVAEQIAALPGIEGLPTRTDETLPDAEAVRFDYVVNDPDLGALRVRSYLFRFGGQAYLVNFAAPTAAFGGLEPVIADIVESLRFGI
jgi:hypothetical protein